MLPNEEEYTRINSIILYGVLLKNTFIRKAVGLADLVHLQTYRNMLLSLFYSSTHLSAATLHVIRLRVKEVKERLQLSVLLLGHVAVNIKIF